MLKKKKKNEPLERYNRKIKHRDTRREWGKNKTKQKARDTERDGDKVCVRVCVSERDRETSRKGKTEEYAQTDKGALLHKKRNITKNIGKQENRSKKNEI